MSLHSKFCTLEKQIFKERFTVSKKLCKVKLTIESKYSSKTYTVSACVYCLLACFTKICNRFAKDGPCQFNLIAIFVKITDFLDNGIAVNPICLGFNRAFVAIPQGKSLVKLEKVRTSARSARWVSEIGNME